MLSKLAVNRLTKLADYLASLPAKANKHFNMDAFFDHEGDHDIKSPQSALTKFDCGTSACALGWATTIPSFRKSGLKMDEHGDVQFEDSKHNCFMSASKFFNITKYEAEYLFDGKTRVKTPKQWAKLAKRFIKEEAAA